MSPEAVQEKVFDEIIGEEGLKTGSEDDMVVKFNFIDNDKDQNEFRGDSLKVQWTFNAQQKGR